MTASPGIGAADIRLDTEIKAVGRSFVFRDNTDPERKPDIAFKHERQSVYPVQFCRKSSGICMRFSVRLFKPERKLPVYTKVGRGKGDLGVGVVKAFAGYLRKEPDFAVRFKQILPSDRSECYSYAVFIVYHVFVFPVLKLCIDINRLSHIRVSVGITVRPGL